MFAFAGLRRRFRSFQINRNDGAGLGIFRLKVAPAVGLDFVGPRCEARAIQLQRFPGSHTSDLAEAGASCALAARLQRDRRTRTMKRCVFMRISGEISLYSLYAAICDC